MRVLGQFYFFSRKNFTRTKKHKKHKKHKMHKIQTSDFHSDVFYAHKIVQKATFTQIFYTHTKSIKGIKSTQSIKH